MSVFEVITIFQTKTQYPVKWECANKSIPISISKLLFVAKPVAAIVIAVTAKKTRIVKEIRIFLTG